MLRRELNACRHKVRIVEGKIKKYGKLGKIPMAAGIRVYHEDSEEDASSSSSSESDSEQQNQSVSLFSSKSGSQKKLVPQAKKSSAHIITKGLVY